MKTLFVNIPAHSYHIHIGHSLDFQTLLMPFVAKKQVMIISNTTVAPLYLEHIKDACSDASTVQSYALPDGEQYKNSESMQAIYDALMQAGFHRDCVIIALGGGVVGDMAGFAAATFQRGVDFIQIPTTLLSQVDSSVGGKTGINHALGKNMIGAFKQPKVVLIDTNTLKTLDAREVSAGLAEIIKYALIADIAFLDWLEEHMDALIQLDDQALLTAIYQSCQHKALIVEQDEFEAGKRALLNLGHTFGHAIENHMGYGAWLHGEAVAVGMLQAAHMSYLQGWIAASDVNRVYHILAKAKLPIAPPNMPVDTAINLMMRDKKVKAGQLRLILLKQLGQAFITSDFEQAYLKQTLQTSSLLMT